MKTTVSGSFGHSGKVICVCECVFFLSYQNVDTRLFDVF